MSVRFERSSSEGAGHGVRRDFVQCDRHPTNHREAASPLQLQAEPERTQDEWIATCFDEGCRRLWLRVWFLTALLLLIGAFASSLLGVND